MFLKGSGLALLGDRGQFDESFSKLVPETERLDNTAARSKADLVSKGSLAARHPPSAKRLSFDSDFPDGKRGPLKSLPQRPSLPPPAIPVMKNDPLIAKRCQIVNSCVVFGVQFGVDRVFCLAFSQVRPMRSNSGGSLNSTPQRPRQISQVSLMSTASTISELSMVSSGPEDSFNTTPSPSKFSPLKNPNLSYASLPRSFTRQSSSSTSSPGDVKASPSSLSDIPTTPVRKLFNDRLMAVGLNDSWEFPSDKWID